MEGTHMELVVRRMVMWDEGRALRAFCDVAVERRLLIRGIRVVDGCHGSFISMPRVQGRDSRWHDVVVPLTKELKQGLHRVVLEAYEKASRAGNPDTRGGAVAQ